MEIKVADITVDQVIDCNEILDAFRIKTAGMTNGKSSASYRQAFSAFEKFLRPRQLSDNKFSITLLKEWCSWLFTQGYSKNTVAYYLKLLRLSVVQDTEAISSPIKELEATVLSLPDTMFITGRVSDIKEKLHRLVSKVVLRNEGDYLINPKSTLSEDLVVFAVLAGGLSFDSIADYLKDEYEGGNQVLKQFVTKYARSRNKYLFPLKQSERTQKQMRTYLGQVFKSVLESYGIPPAMPVEDTAAEIWSLIALESGIAPSTVKGAVSKRPLLNPMLAIVDAEMMKDREKASVRQIISDILTDRPAEWYAFRFRHGISYESVTRRLDMHVDRIMLADRYYPCEEITKRIGRKIVHRTSPVMPGLMFMKCRVSDIIRLVGIIGDLAWCYCTDGTDRNSYAVIPQLQMERYQAAIGQFTPDTEIYPAGTLDLRPGDKVEIIGGMFAGRVAEYSTTLKEIAHCQTTGNRIIYRLQFPGDNGIEWTADVVPNLIRKIG